MKPIIEEMSRLCQLHQPFSLATVISRNGSAPRSAGAKMLVRAGGEIRGTVGGGILEAQVRELARQVLRSGEPCVRAFQFDGKDAAVMDAICGGQVEVLVERVNPDDPPAGEIIHGLQAALIRHQKAWLITRFNGASPGTRHALIRQNEPVIGILPATLSIETVQESRLPFRMSTENGFVFVEPVNIAGTAYIFGAGHVSRSLAEFTRAVGFWTVVIDDRPEYANAARFPGVDQIVVLDSLEDWAEKISIDRDSYVVIVTRGHQNDRAVLAQALQFDAAYIGMIGSRRKCALIFDDLRREGFSEEKIKRVHAPIGIPIGAETPEEIGVSITAEMVQVRAALQKEKK